MRLRGMNHRLQGCKARDGAAEPKKARGWGDRLSHRLRRCPWLIWLTPVLGLVSLVWFLIRVIPKPSRATYPCQRLAMPMASGFVVWLTALLGSTLAYRKARRLAVGSRYLLAGFFLGLSVAVVWSLVAATRQQPAQADFASAEPANSPIGQAKGINPGRVVWIRDVNATKWNGSTGSWWDDNNTDQATVDAMVSESLRALTGESSDAAAWDALFKYFNQTHGSGAVGYQPGEKIAIKINKNQDNNRNAWSPNEGNPSPHVIYSLLKQLIEVAGVPGSAITIYDASRYIADPIYNKIRGNPDPDFQAVRFVVKPSLAGYGRLAASYDPAKPFTTRAGVAYLPRCVTDVKYLINMALLRAHSMYGVTLCAKNHFGSIYRGGWSPSPLHDHGGRDKPMNTYNCLVNLNGHKDLAGKTLLYMIDGLYPARNQSSGVIRFKSFGDQWFASILASQDPVAIDSVGLDFLSDEQQRPGTQVRDVVGNPENYLHEMALADNPPSGTFYDPEGDGIRVMSLGVHEHWNNPSERKYSRNLGTGEGIELVTRAEVWTSPDGPIENTTAGKRYDYIQYAINDAHPGDEIVVPAAEYPENINFKGKNVIVTSADPNDPNVVASTVIRGQADEPVVTFATGEGAGCVLRGLTITGGEVGIRCQDTEPIIVDCDIRGNAGAGLSLKGMSKVMMRRCVVANNGGNGIELSQGRSGTSTVTISNCTIAGNSGNGIYSGVQTVTNSIIYYNSGQQVLGNFTTVTYSDVEGGWEGEGNIAEDPCFADPCNGDFHLKSQAGRWDPLAHSWVLDDVTSRCIDAGDPSSDWTAELWPHGKRINMGRYGGTPEASMSLSAVGCAADLDLSERVDLRDFGSFADKWRAEQVFLPEDIDRNGRVDWLDLKDFAQDWLWEPPQ